MAANHSFGRERRISKLFRYILSFGADADLVDRRDGWNGGCNNRIDWIGNRSAPIAHAADDENTRPSLTGLRGVAVIIEDLTPEIERNGLTVSAIRTDVELKLRQAGIPIIGLVNTPGNPFLHISVDVIRSDRPTWPYVITVALHQMVFLTRDPSISVHLATWDVSSYGTIPKQNLRNLRDSVKDLVDEFINIYLAVNPKK
jgi:hypothetical protein